ncbi:hypothetical protein OsJ_36960 [Oryza sativa Japonica Group]|uniref:Uncharacterized protein n=1 Tax=Oryza sativa subsp. japonica TaxID=39947 RepID=B9GEE7_ORYSJ|nr:hypothetical protein OsJ_36960 [Oryza sativa Japonica Group]
MEPSISRRRRIDIALVSLLLLAAAAAAVDAATITMVNRCSYTVWPGALPGGGARLDPGQSWSISVTAGTPAARIWPRTGCSFDGAGRGRCATGRLRRRAVLRRLRRAAHHAGRVHARPPRRRRRRLPRPVAHRRVQRAARGRGPSCAVDITARCLPELRVPGGCASACGKFGGDTYCCRGRFEHVCPPTSYSMFFKGLCPDAYSYAKDDQTSTFTCPAGTNYRVDFCPPTSGVTAGDEDDEIASA